MGQRCDKTHEHAIPGCPYCAVDELMERSKAQLASIDEVDGARD